MADSGVMSAPADEYQQMAQMLTGHWVSQTLRVAAGEAMTPGRRIAIVEMVVGPLGDLGLRALMDMNMLAASEGQERSLDEYDALLTAAGLRRTEIRTTGSPQSVIEAVAGYCLDAPHQSPYAEKELTQLEGNTRA